MAIVEANKDFAIVPKSTPPVPYVFAFSKSQYYIPASAVISYPKKANKLADGTQLGNLLATKAPEKWFNFTHPDFLMKIRGEEGTCVYTTFEIEGHEQEVRFVRLIARGIAEKNFERWREELKDVVCANERQQTRMDVLNWTAKNDCSVRAQLNPEINKWPSLTSLGEEFVKSCRIDTTATKRPKSSIKSKEEEEENFRKKCIKREFFLPVGEKGTYSISEQAGFIHVVDYNANPLSGAGGEGAAEAEEEQ